MNRSRLPRIAVVDDEPAFRTLIGTSLVRSGFEVAEYPDGASAYEGFVSDKPQLVLMDVWMPGPSGYDICRKIRDELQDLMTPIIIMTGNDDLSSIKQAFESGATDFFPKPVNIPLLEQRIRYALRNAEAWQLQASYQHQLWLSEKMASLGQLAAGVAHEINNPVGYVQSNVQVLSRYASDLMQYLANLNRIAGTTAEAESRQADLDEARQRFGIDAIEADLPDMMKDIEEGLDRVGEIVKSLRTYAHPEEDRMSPTELAELLQSVGKMMVGDLKHKADVALQLPAAPVWVSANPSKLYQVLVNLLVNALQSIDHSDGRVQLILRTDPDRAFIDVVDNGSGMDEDVLNRLFDPFFTTKEIGEGTGLGLSVSQSIVEKHQGTLSVSSQPGAGSTFTLALKQIPAPS